MSFRKTFAVYLRNILVDLGTDKDALAAEYPASKGFLILPWVR